MNWNHIKAVFAKRLIYHEADNVVIASNGHIALPWPHDLPKRKEQLKECAYIWRTNAALPVDPSVPGKLVSGYSGRYYRQIGTAFVDEAYFRCLHDSSVTWSIGANVDSPLRVHRDGELIAIVMPIKAGSSELGESGEITDEEVFSEFARPENSYYLVTEKKLLGQIQDLQDDIRSNRDQIRDLQDEIDDAEDQVKTMTAALEKLRVSVGTV